MLSWEEVLCRRLLIMITLPEPPQRPIPARPLLVLGSYTRTDTNDLAGGARRGKGAMVTSHTSFVLKVVVVVVVKVRLSQTHSTIYSTVPSYACICTYASRPPSRSHREPQHPDEPRRSVRRARLLRRARPAACVSSTASAAVVACLPRLLLVSPVKMRASVRFSF